VRELSYYGAILEALREEMERDERVVLIGEDIATLAAPGPLGVGPERVWSTPISENGFVGMAVGAAMTGLRPVVDLTISNFLYLAMDPLCNQAAKLRYMTGGQTSVPAVFRVPMWYGLAMAAQHSDRPYPLFLNTPGLKLVVPATPRDARGLLKAAVRDDDPVLFFDDFRLWSQAGPVPEHDEVIPLGVAETRREGRDASVVAIGAAVGLALEAAAQLEREGISIEVIDPRSLAPLDDAAILVSVAKTGRLVVVEYAHRTHGAGAEIAARVAEQGFRDLRAPIRRVATQDVPIPYSPSLEAPLYPSAERIAEAVRGLL